MKTLRKLYHFLGGVVFAIILIASVTIFVIAGTVIESLTQSHRYAALFTYDNPLFAFLLWGFFINILFSATRRWPFKWRHIPFLITHLGLLMILAGVLAKHYFGMQGSMSLSEGSASHEIMENHSYAISVDSKKEGLHSLYSFQKSLGGNFTAHIAKTDTLNIRLAEFYPHCKEHLASWVKNNHAVIVGLKPMPLFSDSPNEETIPVSGRAKFLENSPEIWDLYAIKTQNIENTLQKLFLQNGDVLVKNKLTHEMENKIPLLQLKAENTLYSSELSLNFSSIDGFKNPSLEIQWQSTTPIVIPLQGYKTSLNLDKNLEIATHPLSFDIQKTPLFAVIEDEHEDVFLVSFDRHGKVWVKSYLRGGMDSLVAYDDGFSGYTVKVDIPLKTDNASREEKENVLNKHLKQQLESALSHNIELSPPLQLFLEASKKANLSFSETLVDFLNYWNASATWLYPEELSLSPDLKQIFTHLDWQSTPSKIKQGCEWSRRLFTQIQPDLKNNTDLIAVLRKNSWPLLSSMETEIKNSNQKNTEFTLLTHQLFAAAEVLPKLSDENSRENSLEVLATLFSAYLQVYGLQLSTILPIPDEEQMEQLLNDLNSASNEKSSSKITLETTVIPIQKAIMPGRKLEENFPKVTLYVNQGQRAQKMSLSYDRTSSGLKWPVLDGDYLLRFQPQFQTIPYRLRLRQARQINYANSSQPYSFESDLIFTDQRNQQKVEKTISMNQVYETWDGYRFYLSSISPPNETATKNVQIVVNYDPAKYVLTYPGALILSCGIFLLFIMRPYRRPKQS